MKAIMMSIRPQWVAKILNGEKTLEIRKRFPKDYVGWVYIYCTKMKPEFYFNNGKSFVDIGEQLPTINGKVVARFWCDRVSDFFCYTNDLLKQACLIEDELLDYLGNKNGYAIHITNLEIFDKPKDFKNFLIYSHTVGGIGFKGEEKQFKILKPLNRAPQSYCFIRDVL